MNRKSMETERGVNVNIVRNLPGAEEYELHSYHEHDGIPDSSHMKCIDFALNSTKLKLTAANLLREHFLEPLIHMYNDGLLPETIKADEDGKLLQTLYAIHKSIATAPDVDVLMRIMTPVLSNSLNSAVGAVTSDIRNNSQLLNAILDHLLQKASGDVNENTSPEEVYQKRVDDIAHMNASVLTEFCIAFLEDLAPALHELLDAALSNAKLLLKASSKCNIQRIEVMENPASKKTYFGSLYERCKNDEESVCVSEVPFIAGVLLNHLQKKTFADAFDDTPELADA